MAVELATGYVSLVPSARGISSAISRELGAPTSAAAATAGANASKSFSSRFAGGLAKLGKVAFAGLAVGAAAAGVGLFKLGQSFDSAFDTIRVGTGATGKALAGLQESFRNVVRSVPTDFGSASTAIADINTRLGLTGKPLEAVASRMLEMTRLTGGDLKINIEKVTRLFGDFGVQAAGQAGAMDKLFRASQSTGIGIDRLSDLMVQFGSPLRQLGFDFDEAAALFGKFEQEGVNIQTAMPGLRQALKNFAQDGREPAEALLETIDAIKNAKTTAEANTLAFETFGTRAGPDLAAAIREGRFELGDLIAEVKGGKDTILGAAADTEDFGEKWTKLKNRVFVALEPLARKLFDAIGLGMDKVGELAPAVSAFFATLGDWWDSNGPRISQFVDSVFGAIAGWIGEVGPAIRDWVQDVLGNLGDWWDDHGPTIVSVVTAIGAALVTIATVGKTAAQAIVRNWDRVQGPLRVVASVIGALLIPHLIRLGVQSTISAAKQAAAWVVAQAGAARAAAVHVAESAIIVGRWVFMGTRALLHAAKVAAAWVLTHGPAMAVAVAAVAAAVARQVAQWAVLGAQALLHAAKVAAAWLISLGPIGLVIAAVAAAAALIIIHWETIRDFVTGAARAVVGFLQRNWPLILAILTGPIGLAVLAIVKHWDKIRDAFVAGWEFISGFFTALPGRIAAFLVDAGKWLFDAGKAVLRGLRDGIKWFWDNVVKAWFKVKDWVVGTIVKATEWLYEVGKSILRGLKNGIDWLWKNEVKGWLKIKDWVVGTIVKAATWLYEIGKSVLRGLKTGIKWLWDNEVKGWLKIKDWILGLVSKPGLWLYNTGKAVINGLKNGMKWVIDRIGSFLKSVKDAVVKGFKAVFGISSPASIMVPLGKNIMRGLLKGLVDSVPGMKGIITSIGGSLQGFMSKAFGAGKGILSDIWGALPFGGGGPGDFSGAIAAGMGRVGGGVERWRGVALAALSAAGQSAMWVNDLLRQMQHESGGNPRAINLWDINAKRGTPSMGLMQTIPSTFNAYAGRLRGRGIWDPLANIFAAIKYTVSRYGDLGAWRRRGFKGYGSGGVLDTTGLYFGHRGEVVFTPDQLRVLGSAIGRSPADVSARGPAVNIERVELHDGVDVDLLNRRIEFLVAGGRL